MNVRAIYLGLCILGVMLPYSQFVPWVMTHGINAPLFFRELFSTHIGFYVPGSS
ncbi:DUF2834 domain-containing protein [Lacimicrobium alkaliphilum]|uniref:DUF2834 domain-containing protein n=1 Tax=Lacimicrobium alkaliphilum TaxID=1526571 RepID=UPI000BFEE752